jgi:hypothetical protein
LDSPQVEWLKADLAANPAQCTLAYWHEPRFSSGAHGNSENASVFWDVLYEADVEVVLVADDHHYERFAPQDPAGIADSARGIRQFVVGTGGRNLGELEVLQPNSEIFHSETFGVLKLDLHPVGYDWEFIGEADSGFTDTGSDVCH